MKRVVSVSLGSAVRDYQISLHLAGDEVEVCRIGVPWREARSLLQGLDGQVDAIGLGGINLWFFCGPQRYPFRQGQQLVGLAKKTPVMDGSYLKEWVEPLAVPFLEQEYGLQFLGRQVLFVSALDRFPLGWALEQHGARLIIGDAIFALGLPLVFHSLRSFAWAARATLPLFNWWPIDRLYPIGSAQEERVRPRMLLASCYQQADYVAGDAHFILRYLPAELSGKVIITSTLRAEDIAGLQYRGVKALVTFFPLAQGVALASNAWEAALLAVLGKEHFGREEVLGCLQDAGWHPGVQFFC